MMSRVDLGCPESTVDLDPYWECESESGSRSIDIELK
jgi:hypothetical protein